MANSPSQKWENGRLVERAIETNRWKILPDGTEVGESEEETVTKQVTADTAENKSVKPARAAKK